MLAPMINPYDAHMTKEETKRTWEKWLPRRKMMYSLTRRFSKLLNFFYRKSLLPEKHDEINKLLSFSPGKKELHVQKKCQTRGILIWLKSMYSQADCELVGFLGLTHIWQTKPTKKSNDAVLKGWSRAPHCSLKVSNTN
ncbi:hypothetical protein GmHk_14G041185 [Glycine max]|nr:hypothetical protein GmHk_14G041185 [Glycine max]